MQPEPEVPLSTRASMRGELAALETLSIRFLLGLLCAILIYSLAIAWGNKVVAADASSLLSGAASFFRSTGFLLGIYVSLLAAAIVGGGLLGFLFGIPRLLQHAQPLQATGATATETTASGASAPTFAGNTNLEQISDWLTKIIVGIGLTQAADLYTGFKNAKTEFATVSMANTGGSDVMFTTVLLSGIALGFLFFYLETRTRVTLLLVTADHVQSSFSAERAALARVVNDPDREREIGKTRITTNLGASPQKPPSTDDMQITTLPLSALRDANELAAWAMSQVRMGNFGAAETALRRAIADMPNRPELQTALAAVKNWAGRPEEANRILDEAARNFPANVKVLRDKLLASLYLDPPQSFEQALEAARQLKENDPAAADDPFVSLWIACAYGQKFKHGKDAADRAAALEAIRNVIRNSHPGSLVRKTLHEVFDPVSQNADSEENDLEVFKDDQEFIAEMKKTT